MPTTKTRSYRQIALRDGAADNDWGIITASNKRTALQRQFVSAQEASELTGLSSWTWRAWAYSGKISSVKCGAGKRARLLIPVSEIERILRAGLRPRRESR